MYLLAGLLLCLLAAAAFGARLRQPGKLAVTVALGLSAALFPLTILTDAYVGLLTYEPASTSDPGDSPGYVLAGALMLSPVFILVGLFPAAAGFLLGRRYHPENKDDSDLRPLKLN